MNDRLRRFNTINIHIIGACTILVLVLALYFLMVKPKTEDIQKVQADTKATQDAGGTPEKVAEQKRNLNKANVVAADTKAKWQVNQFKYMPNIDLSSANLLDTYENNLIKIPAQWGHWVAAWYDAQRPLGIERAPGVDFPVDAFPADPNYISTLTSLKFPQGNSWPVTVYAKSFDDAMAHLRRFNNMERHGMPVVDNVSLSGQSPNLQLSYNLAMYIIMEKQPPASDPTISTGTGASGGGGMMPGMMGGGMMGGGMPPGMMGGRGGRAGGMGGPGAGKAD